MNPNDIFAEALPLTRRGGRPGRIGELAMGLGKFLQDAWNYATRELAEEHLQRSMICAPWGVIPTMESPFQFMRRRGNAQW